MCLFGRHQSYYGHLGPIQYVNTWLVVWFLCGHKAMKLHAVTRDIILGKDVQQLLCFYCSDEGIIYIYIYIYIHIYMYACIHLYRYMYLSI